MSTEAAGRVASFTAWHVIVFGLAIGGLAGIITGLWH
jgi:hypothetical protein